MIAADAIAPGWLIITALVFLAVAISYCFVEGDEREQQIRSLTDPEHVRVVPNLYDGEVDVLQPNEQCVACGLEVETYHDRCQGHTRCLTECPRCGGKLEEI